MINSNIIITTLTFLTLALSLSHQNRQKYQLIHNQSLQKHIKLQYSVRITFAQYQGSALLTIQSDDNTIINTTNSLEQITLTDQFIGKSITILITGNNAIGILIQQPIQQFQILTIGEEKLFHLKKGQIRVVQIHPRQQSRIVIQRLQGIPVFTNNRCKSFQKIDCFNQLQRIDHIKMTNSIEIVDLDYCSSCIFLIKIQTQSNQLKLRLSINSNITMLDSYPTVSLLKQGKTAKFILYGEANKRGKIIHLTGSIMIQSNLTITQFENGMFYQLNKDHSLSTPTEIAIKGLQKQNYFIIEPPHNELLIRLKDGYPTTIKLQYGNNYTILFQNSQPGRGNFVIAGLSSFMDRLSLHFINKQNNQKYSVRPHYLFSVGHGSQNFQLDNSTADVQVQLRVTSGFGGLINVSASVNEPLNLPLDWTHSSLLNYNQVDHYVLQGIDGNVQVIIHKCINCNLNVGFGSYSDKIVTEQIQQRIFNKIVAPKNGQLFIQVKTNNYAYYQIVVIKSRPQVQKPKLTKTNISVYLTQPQGNLELEFEPPKCGNQYCDQVKYYLIQGSDQRHVSSRAFCPNSLFDFDQRTKDIVLQQIQPKRLTESSLSHIRPLHRHDWLVIVAQTNDQILSYDTVNSGQVRLYNSMRWPIFYLVMFISLAGFLSFVLFMGLRKRNAQQTSGYIRCASPASAEELS